MLQGFFDFLNGRGFEPHGTCYLWSPQLIALHVACDTLIAVAYYSIPLLLIYFVRKRTDLPFGWIFGMFGLFIVACGTTHVLAIYEIWHGAYWLSGAVKAVTAAASVGTALMLAPLIPRALALRSPMELDQINRQLASSLEEKERLLELYAREHFVASTLQRASLPTKLPNVAGLRFDAFYRAGSPEAEVGGDWYDVVDLGAGRVVLSVGDVAGRGLSAAVEMAKLRQSFRTMALEDAGPAALLRAGHVTLRSENWDSMATAFVARYAPDAQTLTFAGAGHPPAMLRLPDGTIQELSGSGLPLGFRREGDDAVRSVQVPRGAILVLYTDGLVEAQRNIELGIAALRSTIADPAFASVPTPASYLVDAVAPSGIYDDVAVLVTSF